MTHGRREHGSVGLVLVVRREMSLGQEAHDQLIEVVWALEWHDVR